MSGDEFIRDWIPSREQDFVDLCQKWLSLMEDNGAIAEYGWNKNDCYDLAGKIRTFLDARSAYEADDSTANRIIKDEKKEIVIKSMRNFANTSVRYNEKIDKAVKDRMRVRTRKPNPTRNERPSDQPDLIVENTPNRFEHKLKALNRLNGKAVKPAGVAGMKFAYQIGGVKPVSGADLPKGQFSGKTTFIAKHTEANKGQPVYYSVCYENARGEQGPWSSVVEAIIG